MEIRAHRTRYRQVLPVGLAVLGSLVVLLLFSSWNRPLLYDEYVQFAVSGLPSTSDALAIISLTTTNLNQGATGAYHLADYWLLQIFGAHTGALRAPGVATGGLLFVYAGVFLWQRKVSLWSLPAIPLVFATQELVLRYVGEARPYMPLAAASVGVLAYYSFERKARASWWGRATGWSSVIIGVLFHPYFLVYWGAIAVFGWVVWKRQSPDWPLVKYVNTRLLLVGVSVYAVVGVLTWMRGKATAEVDPFNFLPGPVPIEIVAQNLYFLRSSPTVIVATIVLAGAPLVAAAMQRTPLRVLVGLSIPPVLLILLSFLLALFISLTTLVNDFWIFPRQWIASTALTGLGGIWLVAEWWKATSGDRRPRTSPVRRKILVILSTLSLLTVTFPSLVEQVRRIQEWNDRPRSTLSNQAELRTRLDRGQTLTDSEWIAYARVNIDVGGDVWPEFGRYYTETDWNTFVLTDGSQSKGTQ